MSNIAVIYLLREQEGVEPFFESYLRYCSGLGHELFVLTKGYSAILPAKYCEYPKHQELFYYDLLGCDLDAYRYAAKKLKDYNWLLFFNSKTVLRKNDWLLDYTKKVQDDTAIIGGSYSFESFYSNNPTWWRKLFFKPAPNLHIRTNGFMIRRDVMLKIWPHFVWYRKISYLFESGRFGLMQRIKDLGYSYELIDGVFSDNRCKCDGVGYGIS